MCGAHACATRLDHAYAQVGVGVGEARVLDVKSMSNAAVSLNAVRSRLYGLAQPVSN
jgi:hypothetical protein